MRIRSLTLKSLAAGLVLAVGLPAVAMAAHPFDDVPDGQWFSEPVDWAFNNGITTGTSPTTFDGWNTMNRYEGVTFIHRFHTEIVEPMVLAVDAKVEAVAADLDDAEDDIDDNAHNIAVVAGDLNNATRVYFARVAADGEVEQTSSEELEVSKDGNGFYEVTIPEAADNCVATATTHFHAEGADLLGGLNTAVTHGNVVTFHDTSDLAPVDEISVLTYTGDPGLATDMPFSITVSCSDPEFVIFDPGVLIPPVISLGD